MFGLLCKRLDKFQNRQNDWFSKCIVFFCNFCKRYFCKSSRFLTFTHLKFVNSVVVFLIEYNHVFAHSVLVQLRVPLKTTHIGLVEKAIFIIACIQKNPSFFHIIQCQAYPFVLILSTQKHDKKKLFFRATT